MCSHTTPHHAARIVRIAGIAGTTNKPLTQHTFCTSKHNNDIFLCTPHSHLPGNAQPRHPSITESVPRLAKEEQGRETAPAIRSEAEEGRAAKTNVRRVLRTTFLPGRWRCRAESPRETRGLGDQKTFSKLGRREEAFCSFYVQWRPDRRQDGDGLCTSRK